MENQVHLAVMENQVHLAVMENQVHLAVMENQVHLAVMDHQVQKGLKVKEEREVSEELKGPEDGKEMMGKLALLDQQVSA